ncbi:GDSL-type esterase/lipase family protein [Microbacterium sp. cx-55]|uniref:GDSL-type esterase/lipase family protein n=1 Tax=Microbacterium sp. cx-55 TaxID=2875948 RepID=UPI001CBC48A6|nr:GDSL-type esterase/lipase family protein [Microbacterium sp. cx-55]MBZ4488590.1 glycosyltransferase [Microbacterium sp. cx-55]UGB36169.1 GDSL-type esterase/lipase family protein [Microbacterium sp. cx-55]
MRVALIAESYLPHMNGVTNSVLHVLRHLAAEGHEALVIAPRTAETIDAVSGARTELLTSLPLPSYPQVRVVFARVARIAGILREFRPDVIHLASPFVLGWQGVLAADALRTASVAVYQTDVVAYTQRYGVPHATAFASSHVARLHRRATMTLAPSTSSLRQLEDLGVDRLRSWARGVDGERFHPGRRDEAWRARVAPGERIIGYVGRLAPEKQVEDLAVLERLPGARLVIVGDGPSRAALERRMPHAIFLGHLSGDALADALAAFDVFVHPGESETFGQTIQEAHASGVPVVATGIGGPKDLVRSSIDGWLYRPGDLGDLRGRVTDLLGDEAKRLAFAAASRAAVADRTWAALSSQLVGHYEEARMLRPIDDALWSRAAIRPAALRPAVTPTRWSRYVALGDSLTEGLCDTSRTPAGAYRGWADRLAHLLAQEPGSREPFRYANLAVRSRRVRDLTNDQIPRALTLRPDLVSVFMGANDLIGHAADPLILGAELERGVARLRAAGCDVLLVTPFLPRRRAARLFARRFAIFNSEVRRIARAHDCLLLDLEALPQIGELEMWADDKVHLRSRGHRFLSYRAADVLGVRDAEALGDLDASFHEDEPSGAGWLRRDALPWVWRRLRGRTAGDGLSPKHDAYVELPRPDADRRSRQAR